MLVPPPPHHFHRSFSTNEFLEGARSFVNAHGRIVHVLACTSIVNTHGSLPELDWRLRIGGREPENSPAKVYRADGDARAGVFLLRPYVRR